MEPEKVDLFRRRCTILTKRWLKPAKSLAVRVWDIPSQSGCGMQRERKANDA